MSFSTGKGLGLFTEGEREDVDARVYGTEEERAAWRRRLQIKADLDKQLRWEAEVNRVRNAIQGQTLQPFIFGAGAFGTTVARGYLAVQAGATAKEGYVACIEGSGEDCGRFAVPVVIAGVVWRGTGRALTKSDIGLSSAQLQELRGTVVEAGNTRIIRVDMIRGSIPPAELLRALPRTIAAAEAQGIRVLQFEGTFANTRLYQLLERQIERYGGMVSNAGGVDTITFIIGRRRR